MIKGDNRVRGTRVKGFIGLFILCIFGQLSAACAPSANQHIRQIEPEQYRAEAAPKTADVAHISDGNYAYEKLSEEGRQVYDEILTGILAHQEKITLSSSDTDVMRKAYIAVCADYGGLFWVNGYVFTKYNRGEEVVGLEFAPNYVMTLEEREQTQKQIDNVVDEWLGGISMMDTDYDKVKYIYELLSTNTEYVEEAENSQNIISVFLNRQTVCQGYACAVQYLMKQLGIKCVIVSGTALGDAHAWNLFQMDGEYYYMDVTWGRGRYTQNAAEKFFVDYKYMAMTTEEMLRSHIPNQELPLPECTAVENNYYIKEGKYIEEWNPDEIGTELSEAWTEKQMLILRFADKELYNQTINYFIEKGNLAEYCSNIEQVTYMADEVWQEISFCFLE